MNERAAGIDWVYIAASAKDGRFTRICVASIRYFYPDVSIKLLAGGPLEPTLEAELRRYWNVAVAALPRGDWGWGFIKLEPLFGPAGERFLVVDSDTVMTGPILDVWAKADAPFLVDDELQTEADTHRLYYDWRKLKAIDLEARPPQFVFNSGQWFGTAGLVGRADFERWIDWSGMPPRHRYPAHFMPGDQGVLNYVLNQKAALAGLHVARDKIMLWPGHGMTGITGRAVANGDAPPRIIHWAGMKASRIGAMAGGDVLHYFEHLYYDRLPQGLARRVTRQIAYAIAAMRDAMLGRFFRRGAASLKELVRSAL